MSKIYREKDPAFFALLKQEGLKARGFDPGPIDNWWGLRSSEAYDAFLKSMSAGRCLASTFADEADVAAFKRCKAKGKSDQECFKVGDNGIGYWGAETTTSQPMVALPPEDIIEKWGTLNGGRKKVVIVRYAAVSARCTVEDVMPHRENIENGAGIDLNPGAVSALGIPPGGMVEVEWEWA